MTQTSPTYNQIKAQIAAIRKKIPNTRSVAIRAKTKWTGNTRQEDGGETYFIHQCDSPLAMRLALREGGDSVTTVLVTDLADHEIGEDIFVRLKPRKLVPLDSWQIVKSLFQARTIDPRITRHGWIAEMLMELIPTEGFPPVASGFLDAETVWTILLNRVIGLDADGPDLLALLKWSTNSNHVARFRSTPYVFRDAAIEWLVTYAGPTVATVLHCVASSDRPDALPLGLAAGVVFHAEAKGKLDKAAGKLEERYLGGQSPAPAVIDCWAASSTEIVRLQLSDTRLKQQLLQRTDEILREVGAQSHALLSDTSPLGFDQRLARFGTRLATALEASSPANIETVAEARETVFQHDLAAPERRRLERCDMAIRLLRSLVSTDAAGPPSSLADAAARYLSEGGYVDWARLSLRAGDPTREVSDAYRQLFDCVTAIQEQRASSFAQLLRDWAAVKADDNSVIPVESVLDRIVAPLAAHSPVLVVVLDGMSVAVFRQLLVDLLGREWSLLAEESRGLRCAVATFPSVTEVSRTSLLCGRLIQGDSSTEREGFGSHAALVAESRSGSPPVLFHKASLQESGDVSLSPDVRREIGSAHRQVVGIVVNAIDDHLLKGEQIDTRWTRDEIKVLPALLHEAKAAQRLVILLSDHGHVLDCGAEGRKFDGGERWRTADGELLQGELLLTGPRVLIPDSKRLIAPWTEKLRYGIKKNGYHGGLSPQEMLAPIGVLCSSDRYPPGWAEAPVDMPSWWDATFIGKTTERHSTPDLKPVAPRSAPPGLLFDKDSRSTIVPTPDAVRQQPTRATWIVALLASETLGDQKRLGGRAIPSDDVFSRLLEIIDDRGGKITSTALAKSIGYSPLRLRGLLAVAQRVLNIDGYAVLTRDESSDTVSLDLPLLLRQFDLIE